MTTASGRKRLCLFAGYNHFGRIAPYVMDYLAELRRHATVFYLADGSLEDAELQRIKTVCEDAWVVDHGEYDFGSYSRLAKTFVGWDRLNRFDEVLFANDSCFCLQPFDPVFAAMDREDCDFWCMLGTDENNRERLYTFEEYVRIPGKKIPYLCFGSYFLAFRPQVLRDSDLRMFLNAVTRQPDRTAVCRRYEMGLTRLLIERRFRLSAFVKIVYRNVAIYGEQAFRLLKKGFPLLKIRIFRTNPLGVQNLEDWFPIVSDYVGNKRIFSYLEQLRLQSAAQIEPPIVEHTTSPPRGHAATVLDRWIPPIIRGGPKAAAKLLIPPVVLTRYRDLRAPVKSRTPPPELMPPTPSSELDRIPPEARRSDYLVIFFNLAYDTIGGGMLSINRFVAVSLDLRREFGFDVLVSGVPLYENVVEYSMFKSAAPMVHFSEIVRRIGPRRVIMNLPEYSIPDFLAQLTSEQLRWMKKRPYLRINILDQNHDLLPEREVIERLREISDDVTLTAAHVRVVTQQTASDTDCPVGLLTPFLPKCRRPPFAEKEKIIAVSPDLGPQARDGVLKKGILSSLARSLPDYRVVTIENMSLDSYREFIARAKFTVTFGEGFDGYFVESFLSESVAFAVYNDTFFPDEFRNSPTVYPSWRVLAERIAPDIRCLESDLPRYRLVQQSTEQRIRRYANDELSMVNLRDFYNGTFAYLPEVFQRDPLYRESAGRRGNFGLSQ